LFGFARGVALRFSICAALVFFIGGLNAVAQESQHGDEAAATDSTGMWKIINTALFAALVAWFLVKNGPRFFNARSADIQKAIQDATGLKIEADFRYSEIDKKMATLADEVARIREQSRGEMDREHERFRSQTEQEIARIRQSGLNEIDALRQEAANRVQLHTAESALDLAERRLQERFARGEQDGLVGELVRLIERGKN
jgi:F0F1-type ATP synthase membrane subunit b/b'